MSRTFLCFHFPILTKSFFWTCFNGVTILKWVVDDNDSEANKRDGGI